MIEGAVEFFTDEYLDACLFEGNKWLSGEPPYQSPDVL